MLLNQRPVDSETEEEEGGVGLGIEYLRREHCGGMPGVWALVFEDPLQLCVYVLL